MGMRVRRVEIIFLEFLCWTLAAEDDDRGCSLLHAGALNIALSAENDELSAKREVQSPCRYWSRGNYHVGVTYAECMEGDGCNLRILTAVLGNILYKR